MKAFLRNAGWLAILTGCPIGVNAAPAPEECLLAVRATYERLHQVATSHPAPGQGCYLRYTVTTTMVDSAGVPPPTTTVEMWAGSKEVHFISPELEFYQDERDAITLIRNEGLVYVGEPYPTTALEARKSQMLFMQEAFFDSATVSNCRNEESATGTVTRVVLVPHGWAGRPREMREAAFLIDFTTGDLRAMEFEYRPPWEGVVHLKVTFEELDATRPAPPDEGDVRNRFLDDEGRLIREYDGFRLMNLRQAIAGQR